MTNAIVENGKMSGMDDVFGEKGEVVEKVEAAQPEPVVEAVEPTQPAPEPKGEAEVAPPAAAPEEPKHIPISAILDEREKRQLAQRRADELEAKLREYEDKQREASQKRPDFYENPDEYVKQFQAQQQHAIWNERLNMSEMMAVNKHGGEAVSAAADAFKQAATQNPALVYEFQQQRDPYGFVLQWHQRNQLVSEIGSDPAAYKERLRQELMAELQAQQPAAPVQQQASPRLPGSLTQAPSAAKSQHVATATFDSLFSGN